MFRQVVVEVEPGDLLFREDVALRRHEIWLVEAAHGDVDLAGKTDALIGQGGAALGAEGSPHALGRLNQAW